MKKAILGLVLGFVVIMLLTLLLILVPVKKAAASVVKTNPDIEVFFPKPNQVISSPLKITGVVRGNGWGGFEGQVGTVHVVDVNGKELAVTFLPATTEWTQLPVNFETNITFNAVSGTSGSLVFKNENPSGDPVRDKIFTLPIRFK